MNLKIFPRQDWKSDELFAGVNKVFEQFFKPIVAARRQTAAFVLLAELSGFLPKAATVIKPISMFNPPPTLLNSAR
jgi:hypothetical protein